MSKTQTEVTEAIADLEKALMAQHEVRKQVTAANFKLIRSQLGLAQTQDQVASILATFGPNMPSSW